MARVGFFADAGLLATKNCLFFCRRDPVWSCHTAISKKDRYPYDNLDSKNRMEMMFKIIEYMSVNAGKGKDW